LSDEILINVTPTESRVALVEHGLLQEFYLERRELTSHVGNIYMGRVERVMPGMQAAFVEVGLARTAFLHANDIVPRQAELAEGDMEVERVVPPISSLVREGQQVLVQVTKDPLGTKGARLTTQLSIPSRCLVLLPHIDTLGVSMRIDDEAERERLRQLLSDLLAERASNDDQARGFILRTNAEGVGAEALRRDLDYLSRRWQKIQADVAGAQPGQLIYEDLALPFRSLRDLMHAGIERVRIDHAPTLERAERFAKAFYPDWVERLEAYTGSGPLFDLYGVESEIDRALSRTTPLKSGGYLCIDQTEAMTTVDVNSGAFIGARNAAETIFKTNLEAAQTVARQLRLRNLGGIIIIDFIDMDDDEHKRQVMRMLQRALEPDPAKTFVSELSQLGLVEMTRKRTTESLEHRLCEPCQVCLGTGRVKSVETVCGEIFREIVRAVRQFESGQLRVMAAAQVVERILEEHGATIAELAEHLNTDIRFQADAHYHQDQFDVVLL